MLKEIKSKAQEIAKQVIVIQKAEQAYGLQPSMVNGIRYHESIGKLLALSSELASINVEFLTQSVKVMRQSRIKDNKKALGYS